jgi:hypothetical protein
MRFFQKDPVASLAGVRDSLAREEAAIAALKESRAERLAETDDPAPVAQLDEQIERHRRNATLAVYAALSELEQLSVAYLRAS